MIRLLSLLTVALLVPLAAVAAERPNVLFILADDLGWADTTLYGHTDLYRTPNIQRLADRGMTFTRAYADSPLCSPTRSAILTGKSPARTGITAPACHLPEVQLKAVPGTRAPPAKKAIIPRSATRLDTAHVTLAEVLREAGYATGHFGKWHLGPEPFTPLEHGFDVDVPHWPGPGPAGSYVAPWKFPDFEPRDPREHIEDRMAEEAVAFLEEHREGPFFLNYWMFSVHGPFDAKSERIDRYRTEIDPESPQCSPTYAAMIESMDDAVGTLLDALDRLGIADETLVIFFSDNGGNMYNEVDGTSVTSNAPLRGGKATIFEGGIRVPLVVHWPGVTAPGSRNDEVVQGADFFPTLLEILALAQPDDVAFDGLSIVPALRGEPLGRDAIFTWFPHATAVPDWLPPAAAVHSGDWKLIRLFHEGEAGAHRHLLYDLANDIGETTDLSARFPETVAELDTRIEDFLVETDAVRPIPNPQFDPAQYRPELVGQAQLKRAGEKKTAGKGKGKGRAKAKVDHDPFDPVLQGWKARRCRTSVEEGIVTISGVEEGAFLGTSANWLRGPGTVTIRARSRKGGPAQLEWVPEGAKPVTQSFSWPGGEAWREIAVEFPATAPLRLFRIYPPSGGGTIEIDRIDIRGATGERRWEF